MSVYKAINAVQADLVKIGIGKDGTNTQQNYKFRGIDQVYNALSPLLAKHGLLILPRVTGREVTERQTKSGTALFYVALNVEFDFVCAEDGSKHVVVTCGEAMDSGDKATNKAMSAAYKYAVIQAFAIPTEGDNDADQTTHEPISEDEQRKQALEQARKTLHDSILVIKEGIAAGDIYKAAEAWFELSEDEKKAIWVAPKRCVSWGVAPLFTTAERDTIASSNFRKTYYGDTNGVSAETGTRRAV